MDSAEPDRKDGLASVERGQSPDGWPLAQPKDTLRCEDPSSNSRHDGERSESTEDTLVRLSHQIPSVKERIDDLDRLTKLSEAFAAAIDSDGTRTAVDQSIEKVSEHLKEKILEAAAPDLSAARIEREAERNQRVEYTLDAIGRQDRADAAEMDAATEPRVAAPRCEGGPRGRTALP